MAIGSFTSARVQFASQGRWQVRPITAGRGLSSSTMIVARCGCSSPVSKIYDGQSTPEGQVERQGAVTPPVVSGCSHVNPDICSTRCSSAESSRARMGSCRVSAIPHQAAASAFRTSSLIRSRSPSSPRPSLSRRKIRRRISVPILQGPHLSLIHISEPTRLRRISYAVFCLKKKNKNKNNTESYGYYQQNKNIKKSQDKSTRT